MFESFAGGLDDTTGSSSLSGISMRLASVEISAPIVGGFTGEVSIDTNGSIGMRGAFESATGMSTGFTSLVFKVAVFGIWKIHLS